MSIDRYDKMILSALQDDGRISNVELARSINLSESATMRLVRGLEEAVRNIPEVMECYLMSGEFDYLLRVVVADMADFERIHKDTLTRLPGVARVNSSFGIRTVQRKTELPLR